MDRPPSEDAGPAARRDGATIEITVNGSGRTMPAGSTAEDLVALLGLAGRPVAVEWNEQVVPRAGLAGCRLSAGDRVELVTLVGGG